MTGLPEYCDGQVGAREAHVTARWAEPRETADAGAFAIPAYPGMDVPEGCEEVEWPEVAEEVI